MVDRRLVVTPDTPDHAARGLRNRLKNRQFGRF
jgi:hypothetical protein